MNNQKKALLYGMATVGLWSTVASAFKLALRYLDPIQLLLYACITSLVALTCVLIVQKKLPELKKLRKKDIFFCGLLGCLNPFSYYVTLLKAYDVLPAQEAQSINYTWAITLSILSIPLLGQKISFKNVWATLLSYCGVVIIATHGHVLSLHFGNPTGISLAFGSTLIWALYWIANTRSKIDPLVSLFLNFLIALPLIMMATFYFSHFPSLNLPSFLGAVYIGLFEMGVAFVLWFTAMKHAAQPDGGGTTRIANLIFFAPLLSLVFIHFFVGETIHKSTIFGLVFILCGNALMQIDFKKTKSPVESNR